MSYRAKHFPLVFPDFFLSFSLIFMRTQIIYFSYRYMTSTILSSVITGAITMCHNDRLEMKLGHLLFLCVFFPVILKF